MQLPAVSSLNARYLAPQVILGTGAQAADFALQSYNEKPNFSATFIGQNKERDAWNWPNTLLAQLCWPFVLNESARGKAKKVYLAPEVSRWEHVTK